MREIPRRRLASQVLAFALAALNAAAAQQQCALLHSLFDPGTNAQANAGQGLTVALDGNIAVVGVPGAHASGFNSGLVNVYEASSGNLMHRLIRPGEAGGNSFGFSVAISGTRVAVGAYGQITEGRDTGGVYVYELTGISPTVPMLILTNPEPNRLFGFGNSVGISGTRIAVGSPWDSTGANAAGSVCVFDMAGPMPHLPVLVITNPTPAYLEQFGRFLCLYGSRLAIGAPNDDAGAVNAGSAYVYDLSSRTPAVPALTLTNPSPAAEEAFGIALAVSDTWLAVGSIGTVLVYDLTHATPASSILTLTNANPAGGHDFGNSLSISGTRLLVGASYDNVGADIAGAAYVFDLANPLPQVPITIVTNPTPARSDRFGYAVAISGTQLVVGAPGDDTGATGAGSAYSFDLAGITPALPVAALNNPVPAHNDYFGQAVAVSGNRVVVGALYGDAGTNYGGQAYVFDLAASTPTVPMVTITNPSPQAYDRFGETLAISGTRIVVGTPLDQSDPNRTGTVYLYEMTNAVPSAPILTLSNPRLRVFNHFGFSVAISGTRVVVGAPREDAGALGAGITYVYDLSSATPAIPAATLANPNPTMGDNFGFSVACSEAHVVVGAYTDTFGLFSGGLAYVYEPAGASPSVPLVLGNPHPAAGGETFGYSVAISGTHVAVGNPQAFAGGIAPGAVYVYDLSASAPTLPVFVVTNPVPGHFDGFGNSVSIAGEYLVVGAYNDDSGDSDAGSAYVYDLASASPTTPILVLPNPSPAKDDWFGHSVAINGTTIIVGAPLDDTNAPDRGAAYIFGIAEPTLRIQSAPGFVTLSWTPTNSAGCVLQYADRLAPTHWIHAPSGAANPVTIPTTNMAQFYRLAPP